LFTEQLTFTPTKHTLKLGIGGSKNGGVNIVGTNYIGLFSFAGTLRSTRPIPRPIRIVFDSTRRAVPSDEGLAHELLRVGQVQATRMLTLSLGSDTTISTRFRRPRTPSRRACMAFAPNERTLIRAGAGKFYQYQSTAIPANLFAGAVNSPVFTFDTGQDNNPAPEGFQHETFASCP